MGRQRLRTFSLPGKEFIKKTDEFLSRALSRELGEAADVSKENAGNNHRVKLCTV